MSGWVNMNNVQAGFVSLTVADYWQINISNNIVSAYGYPFPPNSSMTVTQLVYYYSTMHSSSFMFSKNKYCPFQLLPKLLE